MTTSATLSPGIKALHLSLDTPVDAVTGKVRRDLSGIRVWYSTTSGFNPSNSEGTLAFNGLSLDITISNLLANTQYYVRYAFVSAIDPTVYTISPQVSALTYDENITVYGNLTNPASVIPTNAAGTDGDYSVAGGIFKVYSYSTEVTGSGVVYSIVENSTVGGLVITLNPTTGAYTVAGVTDDYGSAILAATYDGITIETTLVVIKARAGTDGTDAQLLTINAEGTAFVFKDKAAASSDTTKLTLTANLKNITGTVTWTAQAFDVANNLLGNIAFTQTGNTITITGSQFNPVGYNNAVAYVTVVASRVLLTDTVTLYRINNGTDQIIVEFTNESHTIPAYYDESTVPASYVGSGTEIRVKQGNTYLNVDNSVPYANGTWTVTAVNAVGITPDTTPGIFSNYINYDTHSNMTANRAYIDYTVSGTSLSGESFSITRRQSFAKSVAGEPGATASLVKLTTTQLVFIKFKNGTYSSNSVTIYANTQNIPTPVYTWNDGINAPVVKDSTTDPNAGQFVFNRPAALGVYTIQISVSDKNLTSINAALDSMSIAFIEEGSDAYTFFFKDPNVFLSANSLGIVEGGITSNTNHIIGAKGMALLVPGTDIVYTVNSTENCIATLGSVVGTWNQQFTVSGAFFTDASLNSAKVVIKCQIPGGISYLMTTYYTKVKKGDTGAAGISAILADLASEADVVTSLADGTGYVLPSGNSLKLYSGGTALSSGVTYGGGATKNGLTLAISALGVITLSGATWTSNQETFNITATYGGVTYTANYSIAKSKAGSDAVFVDLLSEAEVVTTASDGTGYTLPTGNSMRLFKGGVQVTTGVVYSGGATQNGLTLAINSTTGAITLSGAAWSSTKETFTLTATFGGVAYTYTYKISKARQGTAGTNGTNGTNGTPGTNAVKSTSGYIYFTSAQSGQPATPSATGFNFSTGAFTGLTAGWSTTVTMTGNGTYWATRYIVTESAFGTNTGTPSFSTPFNHQNFTGLVTFTDQSNALSGYATQTYAGNVASTAASNAVSNRPTYFELQTQGYTTIHGGNISTGTLTVDKISSGSITTQGALTFGFGVGTAIAGISTAGYFKSNTASAAALAAFTNYSPAFAAITTSTNSAAALFSNMNGVYDSISSFDVLVGVALAHSTNQAGIFTQRRTPGLAAASEINPNYGTSAYAKLAFQDPAGGGFAWGAKIMTTDINGNDVRGVTIGGASYGITITGRGAGYFTGCHDGMLEKEIPPEEGDILVDVEVLIVKSISDSLTKVAVSSSAYQKGVLGVYVAPDLDIPVLLTKPIVEKVEENGQEVESVKYILDPQYQQIVDDYDHVVINSIGEGGINVCGEGGTIELGDLIVTSSIPGKGMRQSDDIVRSVTVAKARETVTFSSPTEVKKIACIYLCG